MQSLPLSKWDLKMQDISHVYTIRLRQQESLSDVLILNLVVISSTMKLCEGAIQLEGILASGDDHGEF